MVAVYNMQGAKEQRDPSDYARTDRQMQDTNSHKVSTLHDSGKFFQFEHFRLRTILDVSFSLFVELFLQYLNLRKLCTLLRSLELRAQLQPCLHLHHARLKRQDKKKANVMAN